MRIITAGSTSQSIDIFIPDSSSTTGAGKTGLAYNTSSLVAYYRKGATASPTQITLASLSNAQAAYGSGGFVEIDATNMPGMYRLDLPNAAIDTAARVSLMLKGASGMAPTPVEINCVAVGASLDTSQVNAIADGVLSRNVSNVEGTAPEHSLCTIVLATLEYAVSGSTWTIKRTNGSTTHATKTLTTDGSATPVTGVN